MKIEVKVGTKKLFQIWLGIIKIIKIIVVVGNTPNIITRIGKIEETVIDKIIIIIKVVDLQIDISLVQQINYKRTWVDKGNNLF